MPTSKPRAPAPKAPAAPAPMPGVRVLKKYPNRRLYDTQSSSYITLADVKKMVLDGQPFEVRDAKDGGDLTRSILLQIILEEESGGVPMFSTETLAQIIRLYGHTMQGAMGTWFEQNMKAFAEMQGRMLGGTPMPNVMGSYFEQSQALFKQMQEQAGALFPGFGSKK
jgi:polyhydroxyalkanoate synthesis repressor PhaR